MHRTRPLARHMLLLAALWLAWPAPAPAAAAEPEAASIKGFRSALFGMNETELRRAIAKDLKVKAQDIKAETHPTEKTRVLSVMTSDLLPDSGPALVAYQLGFRSKTLMQVSIVWGRPIDPAPSPQRLVATANTLRNYFAAQQFRAEGRLLNAQVEGGIIAFRGFDADGRMVLLALSSQPGDAAAARAPKVEAAPAPSPHSALASLSLQLTYALNPAKPDVFVIEKGQF